MLHPIKKTILLLLIITCFILSSYSVLFIAPVLPHGESTRYYSYGNEIVKHDVLTYHQLGLWDNQVGFGYPLIGTLSMQFYPFTFLTYFLSNPLLATRIAVIVHLVLAGLACFYLLSILGCNRLCSIFGSILYVVNYYVQGTVMAEVYVEIYNLLWMALAFAFAWKTLYTTKLRYAVFAGIALAMHIIAMLLYTTYFTLILLTFLFPFYVLQTTFSSFSIHKFYLALRHAVTVGVVMSLVAFGVSALKLLPVLQFTAYSMRSSLPLYGLGNLPNSVWELATFQSLFFYLTHFISPFTYYLVKFIPIDINLIFFGLIILSFFKKSKAVFFLLLISIISLWASMGKNASIDLYAYFYRFFPGINTIEHPSRFLILTNLTLPLLASFGLCNLLDLLKHIPKMPTSLKNTIILIIIGLTTLSATKFVFGQQLHLYLPALEQNIPRVKRVDAIDTALKVLEKNEKQPVRVATQIPDVIVNANNYLAYKNGILLTDQLHPDYTLSYFDFPLFSNTKRADTIRKKYTLLSILNTKYIVVQKDYDDYPNQYITFVTNQNGASIYRLNQTLPFIFTPRKTILLIGNNDFNDFNSFEAKVLFLAKDFNANSTSIFTSNALCVSDFTLNQLTQFDAIINSDTCDNNQSNKLLETYQQSGGKVLNLSFSERYYADIRVRMKSIMTNKPAKYLTDDQTKKYEAFLSTFQDNNTSTPPIVSIQSLTPEEIIFRVKTKSIRTALQIADTYFPGWYAYDNNKQIPVYMADGLAKGIIITGIGTHTIDLKFISYPFIIGFILTGLTIFVLLLLWLTNVRTAQTFLIKHFLFVYRHANGGNARKQDDKIKKVTYPAQKKDRGVNKA